MSEVLESAHEEESSCNATLCDLPLALHLRSQAYAPPEVPRTTLSYTGLAKRTVFLGFGSPGEFVGIGWKKLEEKTYGVPLYKLIRRRKSG